MASSGYSGTHLAKKLGIREGQTLQIMYPPKTYREFFDTFPENVTIRLWEIAHAQIDFIHIFSKHPEALQRDLKLAKPNLKKDGILWISWPKKSSKIPSNIDKFMVIKYGQDHGLVDTKVVAIDEDWSGHKFVYRIKDRYTP